MTQRLPVLPVQDQVLFPGVETDLSIPHPIMPTAFQRALEEDVPLLVLTKQPDADPSSVSPFFTMGVTVHVVNFITVQNGSEYLCQVRGLSRFKVNEVYSEGALLMAEGEEPAAPLNESLPTLQKRVSAILALLKQYPKLVKEKFDPDGIKSVRRLRTRPGAFADLLAYAYRVDIAEKQALLEMETPLFRLNRLLDLLEREALVYKIEQELDQKVRASIDENQKRYFLTEKMKAIREELGEGDRDELKELEEKINQAELSEEADRKAREELKRLKMMNLSSAEASVSRTYIQWLTDLPWKQRTRDRLDLDRARAILDRDHYALEDCKERIIEFLAVRKLTRKHKNPILCFVGPPGVGKTSLAKAIAEATGRRFVRMSLGGVRDEAEIRGHRRTYIGAIPGRIINLMKKAGTVNPLMLLDEIDKLSSDFRGDPSSALLEALDPEQNHHFVDHYLDVDYDLSQVFFVVTANVLDTIPAALRDRLEIIRIPGYTFNEKREIGQRHLLPKKVRETGMGRFRPELRPDALDVIIEKYTREAGVRNLERNLEKLFRKFAVDAAGGKITAPLVIDAATVYQRLGVPPFRNQIAEEHPMVGVATGLAWTPVGGDVLFIEVSTMPGSHKIEITGHLGDVMKESVKAAYSYIRSNYEQFGIPPERFRNTDLHIHIPEGAIPKDGPSAGVTVVTAIFSAFTEQPVSNRIAMTGEITLRGRVLSVGGIKEKLLAAHRAGIYEIILPEDNERDLRDIPEEIRSVMTFHFVHRMDEVLEIMFKLNGDSPSATPSGTRDRNLRPGTQRP